MYKYVSKNVPIDAHVQDIYHDIRILGFNGGKRAWCGGGEKEVRREGGKEQRREKERRER